MLPAPSVVAMFTEYHADSGSVIELSEYDEKQIRTQNRFTSFELQYPRLPGLRSAD
jgi:hypothetical protein